MSNCAANWCQQNDNCPPLKRGAVEQTRGEVGVCVRNLQRGCRPTLGRILNLRLR